MSNNLRVAALRLTAIVALVATSAALAAATTTVNLSGTVSTAAAVTAAPTSGATTLNLGGTGTAIGEQVVKVADVTLTTNNSTGLTLTVTSGNLTNEDSVTIAYKVTTVADQAAQPTTAAFTVASGTDYSYSNATTSDARDLYIAYTPAANQDPGTYTGTITLTVADN